MKKTRYFCNLCGQEIEKQKDVFRIILRIQDIITEAGFRPRDTRLVGHLHEDCVKSFLLYSYRSELQLTIPLEQEIVHCMPKVKEIIKE